MSLLQFRFVVCILICATLKKNSSLVKSEFTEDLLVNHGTKLWKHLKENYEPEINPPTIDLKFGIAPRTFKLDLEENTMISHIWVRMVWTDPRFKWVEADWNGVSVLRVQPSSVWIPDMAIYNSVQKILLFDGLCEQPNVVVYPNGEVLWVPTCMIKTACNLNSLRSDPQGNVTCTLKFGSWTYDGIELSMSLYNDKYFADLSDFENNFGYDIVSTFAKRQEKYYPCCEEPYISIMFSFTIKKQDAYTNSTTKHLYSSKY